MLTPYNNHLVTRLMVEMEAFLKTKIVISKLNPKYNQHNFNLVEVTNTCQISIHLVAHWNKKK